MIDPNKVKNHRPVVVAEYASLATTALGQSNPPGLIRDLIKRHPNKVALLHVAYDFLPAKDPIKQAVLFDLVEYLAAAFISPKDKIDHLMDHLHAAETVAFKSPTKWRNDNYYKRAADVWYSAMYVLLAKPACLDVVTIHMHHALCRDDRDQALQASAHQIGRKVVDALLETKPDRAFHLAWKLYKTAHSRDMEACVESLKAASEKFFKAYPQRAREIIPPLVRVEDDPLYIWAQSFKAINRPLPTRPLDVLSGRSTTAAFAVGGIGPHNGR